MVISVPISDSAATVEKDLDSGYYDNGSDLQKVCRGGSSNRNDYDYDRLRHPGIDFQLHHSIRGTSLDDSKQITWTPSDKPDKADTRGSNGQSAGQTPPPRSLSAGFRDDLDGTLHEDSRPHLASVLKAFRRGFRVLCEHRRQFSFHWTEYCELSYLLKQERGGLADAETKLDRLLQMYRMDPGANKLEDLSQITIEVRDRRAGIKLMDSRLNNIEGRCHEEERQLRLVEQQMNDRFCTDNPTEHSDDDGEPPIVDKSRLSASPGSISRKGENLSLQLEILDPDAIETVADEISVPEWTMSEPQRYNDPGALPVLDGQTISNSEGRDAKPTVASHDSGISEDWYHVSHDLIDLDFKGKMSGELFVDVPDDVGHDVTNDSLLAPTLPQMAKRTFDLAPAFAEFNAVVNHADAATRDTSLLAKEPGHVKYELLHIFTDSWLEFSRLLEQLKVYGKVFKYLKTVDYELIDRLIQENSKNSTSALYMPDPPEQSAHSVPLGLKDCSAQATANSPRKTSINMQESKELHSQIGGRGQGQGTRVILDLSSARKPPGSISRRLPNI